MMSSPTPPKTNRRLEALGAAMRECTEKSMLLLTIGKSRMFHRGRGKRLNLRQKTLRCKEAFGDFSIPDEVSRFPIDHHLGGTRPGIVIRAHRHAVSARRHDREQVATRKRELAIAGEKIGRLANRPDDVVALYRALAPGDRL